MVPRGGRAYRVAAVLLGLAAVVSGLTALLGSSRPTYRLDAVMANVRRALRPLPSGGDAAGITFGGSGRVDDIELTMAMAWADDGRFLQEIDGPSMSTATGHDGDVTWEQRPTGAVRQLELGDRARALLLNWIFSGYWADPRAPFTLRIDSRESNRAAAALTLVLEGSNQVVTLWLDAESWLPRKVRIRDAGRDQVLRFENWTADSPAGRPIARAFSLTDGGRLKIELGFDEITAVADFPDGYFVRRPDAARVRFLPQYGTRLEVERGRWGHLFVKPEINGKEVGWFAIDTGATSTSVDRSIVRRLELSVIGDTHSTGVGGEARTTLVRAETLRVGTVELRSIPLASSSMSRIDLGLGGREVGLLGMDLLSHCVIEYDQAASRVSLHDPAGYRLPRDGDWMPLLAYNNKPTVRMVYEDRPGIFTIDTGNPGGILFSPLTVARFDLLDDRTTREISVGGIGGSVPARRGELRWVEWGPRRLENVPADFVTVDRGAIADPERDGVIGTDLLRRFVVVIDMPNRRIAYLDHVPAEAAAAKTP